MEYRPPPVCKKKLGPKNISNYTNTLLQSHVICSYLLLFHQHFQLSMTSKQLKDAASHAKTTKAWRPHQAVQHEYRIWHKQQLSWVVFFCHFDIFTSIFNTILYSIGIFLGLLDISYLFPIRIRKSQELSFELTIIDPKYCYLRKDTNITLLFVE